MVLDNAKSLVQLRINIFFRETTFAQFIRRNLNRFYQFESGDISKLIKDHVIIILLLFPEYRNSFLYSVTNGGVFIDRLVTKMCHMRQKRPVVVKQLYFLEQKFS